MTKIIRDFLDFLTVRKLVEFANPFTEEDTLKYIINRVKEDVEVNINSLVLYELTKLMIKEDVSPEFVRGFKASLDYRLMLIKNNRKLITTK